MLQGGCCLEQFKALDQAPKDVANHKFCPIDLWLKIQPALVLVGKEGDVLDDNTNAHIYKAQSLCIRRWIWLADPPLETNKQVYPLDRSTSGTTLYS